MSKKYALVTGASEGIGYEFCKVFASKGYNLILVARNAEKLQIVAEALTLGYQIECKALPCDLAEANAAQSLFTQVQSLNLEVEILVNNAGLLFNGYFKDIDLVRQEQLLHCNIVALTSLSHLFANEMTKRGGGRILNVASTAAWLAIPNQNIYAASKAYVLSFTNALADEMKAANTGVTVTALCPSYTKTKMLNDPDQGPVLNIPESMILTPEFVAKQGVEACLAGKHTCIPGWSNRLSMALVQRLPKMWVARFIGSRYRKAY